MSLGFGDVVQQAFHAGTGVPRLYAAATHGRGVPGRPNAMRHFMWQATLTARFGLDAARAIAAAQEAGTPSRRDSRADEHNNAAGQAYGSEHAEDLAELTPSEAMTSLVPVALAMWESGELVWVSPRP